MAKKEAVWLDISELQVKYINLFTQEGWTAPFVGMLANAYLLKSKRKGRKLLINEESWMTLLVPVKANLYRSFLNHFTIEEELKFASPQYLGKSGRIKINMDEKNWFTIPELIDEYPGMKEEGIFTVSFIGLLYSKKVIHSKFSYKENKTLILKNSFDEILKYRNSILEESKIGGV